MNSRLSSFSLGWRIDAVGVLVCVALTFAAYFVFVRPTYEGKAEHDLLRAQFIEQTQLVQHARVSLSALKQQLSEADSALRDQPLRLEPATLVNHRLAKLADLAETCGLELHQMKPDTPRSGKRYDLVPIVLTGSGDYRRVTLFIRRVHESFADIGVTRFGLKASNAGSHQAQFNLSLAWYAMPAMGFVQE